MYAWRALFVCMRLQRGIPLHIALHAPSFACAYLKINRLSINLVDQEPPSILGLRERDFSDVLALVLVVYRLGSYLISHNSIG